MAPPPRDRAESPSILRLGLYFLRLGTLGFGGPVALAGFMRRDLVERRRWLSNDDYELALALARSCRAPWRRSSRWRSATSRPDSAGPSSSRSPSSFPPSSWVVALSVAYVSAQGLWWVEALFYTVGATVSAIIAIAAYKLARGTNRRDPLRLGHLRRALQRDRLGAGGARRALHCGWATRPARPSATPSSSLPSATFDDGRVALGAALVTVAPATPSPRRRGRRPTCSCLARLTAPNPGTPSWRMRGGASTVRARYMRESCR